MDLIDGQGALHAGLLSPQGKILFEFFVVRQPEGFLLETARSQGGRAGRAAQDVQAARRRRRSRTRRPTTRWRQSGAVASMHRKASGQRPCGLPIRACRSSAIASWRRCAPTGPSAASTAASATQEDYHAHRIGLGVPEGGKDYAFGDAFPHEALFDQLNGVSFKKGCYVGQEVVSRMQNRGTARQRVVPVVADAALPARGAAIIAGGVEIGTLGSTAGTRGWRRSVSTAPRSFSKRARRCTPATCRCASKSRRGRAFRSKPSQRARPHEQAAANRARALPLGRQRRRVSALSRRGMGRAAENRPRHLREAGAGRLPGRAVVDHDPAQARELPPRLRQVRSQAHCQLRRQGRRAADGRPRHRAQPSQDRSDDRQCQGVLALAQAHDPEKIPVGSPRRTARCRTARVG